MKKNIKYFAIALILLCCLMGAASAADVSADVVDASADAVAVDAVSEDVSDSLESTVVEDEPVVDESEPAQDAIDDEVCDQSQLSAANDELLTETEYIIYVGENKTEDGGNGTIENPYATLDLACDNVDYQEKVTLMIQNGTYDLGSYLRFDTTNLIIQGIGEVIIKSTPAGPGGGVGRAARAFGFKSNGIGTVIMENIIFDASDFKNNFATSKTNPNYFMPVYEGPTDISFINCTFVGFSKTRIINGNQVRSNADGGSIRQKFNFTMCTFYDVAQFNGINDGEEIINFDNCTIVNVTFKNTKPMDLTFNNIWFGQNEVPSALVNYEITKYAVFSASETYIGNNQYEIVGKLVWSGTDDVADCFNPMTVTLSSDTGDIQESAVLADGIFSAIYNSTSSSNLVNVVLDSVEIPLSFNCIGVTVNASDITYGGDQIVNVSLSQAITGTVNLTVNGQTYEVPFDGVDSVLYTIPDALPAGTHEITAKYEDAEHNVWFSSANMTVSKVEDYPFSPVVPSAVQNGEISISLDLPEDATGTLTVTVNGKEYTKALEKGKATVTIDDLPAGTYNATVTYSGDDKYDGSTSNATFTIDPVKTSISAAKVSATYNVAKKLVITLKDSNGNVLAGKKVTVKVGTISKTLTTNAKGQVSLDVSSLVPKTYTATIKFAGDEIYASSSGSAKVAVSKAKSKITAKKKAFKSKVKVKKYTITLKAGKKAIKKVKVSLKVKGKTYKAKTNAKGKAIFKIKKLTKKGKYNAVVKFAGNKYYKKATKKVKITIK